MQLFRVCRDAADNKLNARASDLPSWSSKGISNVFLQSPPLANLKGRPWPSLYNYGDRGQYPCCLVVM